MAENVTFKGGKEVGPKVPKKKHYWWRYLLVWFAGFIFVPLAVGITAAVLGTSYSAKQIIELFGGNVDEILQPGYQGYSLLELVTTLSNQKYETLGDIDKITPAVKNMFDNELNPALDKAVHYSFNWEEIKNKPFTLDPNSTRPEEEYDHTMDLITYIPEALEKGIKIGNFFLDESGHVQAEGILKYIVYPIVVTKDPVTGDDVYTVDTESGNLVSLWDILNSGDTFFDNIKKALRIGDVIDTTGDDFLAQIADWTLSDFTLTNIKTLKIGSLVSGGGAFMDQLADKSIGWLTDANLKTLEIGLLFDNVPEDNLLLKTIKENHWTINDLTDINNIMGLKLNQVIDVSGSSAFIQYIGGSTFNDIMASTFVDNLPLKEIFPNAGGVLGALADLNYTVGDLSNNAKILKLKISDIFTGLKSGDMLYPFRDDSLEDIQTMSISTVLIKDIFPDYASNSILKAVVEMKGADKATVGNLTDQNVINDIPLSAVVSTSGNQVLTALANSGATIGNMSSKINLLTLKDVLDVGSDPNAMIYKVAYSEALKDTPITEIGSNFKNLKLSDIFTVDSTTPQVLKVLCEKGATLDTLGTDMNDLEIQDVMPIYYGDIFKRDLGGGSYSYYILKSDGWELVDDADFPEEYAAYYDSKKGYVVKGLVKEFTGNYVPSKDVTELNKAKERDTLYAVRDTKINDSASMIIALKNNLKLKDVVDITENSPYILKTLKNYKLVDIEDVLRGLTLSEIIDIDSSSSTIMKILANVTVFGDGINNLQHSLENLNIIDLFGEGAYAKGSEASSRNGVKISFSPLESDIDKETGELKPNSNAEKLGKDIVKRRTGHDDIEFIFDSGNRSYFYNYLYSTVEYDSSLIDAAIKQAYQYVTGNPYSGEATFNESESSLVVKVGNYEVKIEAIERHKIDTVYWFMFTEAGETFSADEKFYVFKNGYTYNVNNMSKITGNIVHHVQEESLDTLRAAGFITADDEFFQAVLKETFMGYPIPYGGSRIGDLTINQLIEIITFLLPYISVS